MTRIILKGRTELLKSAITQVLALHQLIAEREIGQFVGYPLEDHVRKKQAPLNLDIIWHSVPHPPWRARSTKDRFVTAAYSIPDIKRSMLDWEKIKLAAGGKNGYNWGRFKVIANLSNGGQMTIYGGSEAEAEERLNELLKLSNAEIVTLNGGEEKKVGRRAADKKLYKPTTRVYPAYFTVSNRDKVVTESNLSTLEGDYKMTEGRINLWTEEAPANLTEILNEVLHIKGANIAS